MNRKSNQVLMGFFSLAIALIRLFSLEPVWVWKWLSLIIIGLIVDLLVIQLVSDRNKKKFDLIKSVALPAFGHDLQGECKLCIHIIEKNSADDADSRLKKFRESINRDIETYDNRAWAHVNDLNLKIIAYVIQRIPNEWMEWNPPEPMRYYNSRHLSILGNRINLFNEKHYGKRENPLGLGYEKDGVDRWKLLVEGHPAIACDNPNERDEMAKKILEIAYTATNDTKFKDLIESFGRIENKYELYKKEMARIMKNAEAKIWLKDDSMLESPNQNCSSGETNCR